MGNPISKLCANKLPGDLFNSALNSKNHLAIESRTAENVFFSIYNLTNGQLLSETQAHKITPWHSLAAIDESSLVLSYFENKQNPDQVSFRRYDLNSDELTDQVDIDSIERPNQKISTLYVPESEGFRMLAQFLEQPLVLGCEYLELDETIIICYYLAFNETFERKLLVLKDGVEALHEVQDKKMTGFAAGSFFSFQNRLIFVKEKTEINIYEI